MLNAYLWTSSFTVMDLDCTVNKMIGPMHVNCWGLMDDGAQMKQNEGDTSFVYQLLICVLLFEKNYVPVKNVSLFFIRF